MVSRRRRRAISNKGCNHKLKEELNSSFNGCQPMKQSVIDDLICAILRSHHQKSIMQLINSEQFVIICHTAISVLGKSETLEFVHDPEGIAVIGDIHGSFSDLVKVLNGTGWPTEKTLVFLGDYTDRGSESVAVILFLLLLKIRYPKRVFLLRGNHETIEVNTEYDLPNVLIEMYGDIGESLFYTLHTVYDWLPIAAILSDQLYCCHGGISQHEYDRNTLRRLPRPMNWLHENTDLADVLLITDTLWSDPAEKDQEDLFLPSDRGISYLFNRDALVNQLRALKCRAIIRAHCPYESGYTTSLDGFCHTVHSTGGSSRNPYLAACLLLDFNEKTCLLEGRVLYHESRQTNDKQLVDKLLKTINTQRDNTPMPYWKAGKCNECELWRKGISKYRVLWDRCLCHEHLFEIIKEFNDVNPSAQYYLERILKCEEKSLAAAAEFPYFLREMGDELMTLKKMKLKSTKSGKENLLEQQYDFEVPIPDDDEIWPKLEVQDQ